MNEMGKRVTGTSILLKLKYLLVLFGNLDNRLKLFGNKDNKLNIFSIYIFSHCISFSFTDSVVLNFG